MTKKIFTVWFVSFHLFSIISAASASAFKAEQQKLYAWTKNLKLQVHMDEPTEDERDLYTEFRLASDFTNILAKAFFLEDPCSMDSLYPKKLFENYKHFSFFNVVDSANNNQLVAFALVIRGPKPSVRRNKLSGPYFSVNDLMAEVIEFIPSPSLSEAKTNAAFEIIINRLFEDCSQVTTLLLNSDRQMIDLFKNAGFSQCHFKALSGKQKEIRSSFLEGSKNCPKELLEQFAKVFNSSDVVKYFKSSTE